MFSDYSNYVLLRKNVSRDSLTRNRERRQHRRSSPLADKPFRLLRNPFAPVEVLSIEQLERIHQTSLHILEEIGLEFLDDEALDLWQTAGAQVDRATGRVRMDRGLIMEAVAKAPAHFTLRARNPAHNLQVGGNYINLLPQPAALMPPTLTEAVAQVLWLLFKSWSGWCSSARCCILSVG